MNEHLSAREKNLLEVLIFATEPLTCRSIAAELGVSDRTVRKDLAALRSWAQQNRSTLEVKPRIGVRLVVPTEIRDVFLQARAHRKFRPGARPPVKGSRLPIILWALLANDVPAGEMISVSSLAAALSVSPGTLRKQLSPAAKWLDGRGVLVSRKAGGVALGCSEWSRRAALCEIVQVVTNAEYEALREAVETALQRVESPELPGLRGSSFYSIVCYLAIALLRVKSGHRIEARGFPWLHLLQEFDTLLDAVGTLCRGLSIGFDDNEADAFCTYVMGSAAKGQGAGLSAGPVTSVQLGQGLSTDGRAAAEILVILVGNSYGLDLLSDEDLLGDLGAHLTLALSRMMTGTATYNPFRKDIQASYPRLYECTAGACRSMQRLIGVPFPEDEIVYVAMYMGAALERRKRSAVTCLIVCPSGMGVARFLSERVMAEYPSIHVKALVPVQGLSDALSQSPVDLVLSPVRVDSWLPKGIEAIVVDPMLTAQDKATISRALGQVEERIDCRLAREQPVAVSPRSMREARIICQRVKGALGIKTLPMTAKALAIHLEFARKRLQRGQVLSQPVAEFRAGYPELFSEVRAAMDTLRMFSQCTVPDAEVVPVMLYFVAQ